MSFIVEIGFFFSQLFLPVLLDESSWTSQVRFPREKIYLPPGSRVPNSATSMFIAKVKLWSVV
jgi:hypothetical protein